MKSSILHFFLLIVEVLFNSALDVIYKRNRFSEALLKKNLEFFLSKGVNLVLFL